MFKDTQAFSSFSVNDLPKAKDFYRKVLGVTVDERPEGLSLKLAGGRETFVYPKPDHVPATFTILNFAVADVERAVAGLRERGVRFESYKLPGLETDADGIARGDGRKMAWFKDPAGNILSVIEGM